MAKLTDDEKLRVLEARAKRNSRGRPTSWEEVAERTGHSKATVLEVDRWFQALPWDTVGTFPPEMQRLRNNYVEHLEHTIMSERPEVQVTKVGPVPDQRTWYTHSLGKVPTSVSVTPTDLGTSALIIIGSVTDRRIQLRSQPNYSGVVAQIRLEYDPRIGSLSWLQPAEPSGNSSRRPGTWTPESRPDRR